MAASVAAERVGSTRARLAELRQRMDRLRAGQAPTHADVERAGALARAQQQAAADAYERLMQTRAAAARRALSLATLSTSLRRVRIDEDRLTTENKRLRDALVSIQTRCPTGRNSSEDSLRPVWLALVDQCRSADWRSWAHAVCVVAARQVPTARGAAMTLYDENQAAYPLAATNRWTQNIEEIHQLVGEGPAFQAVAGRRPIAVDNITEAYHRWPGFVEAAASQGVRSLCAAPIALGGGIGGSLTLYWTEPAPPSSPFTAVELLAEVAGSALLADVDALADDAVRVDPQGYQAVHIAAGMLSVRLGISVAEASLQIRACAYGSGQSLTETARSVIEGTFRLA